MKEFRHIVFYEQDHSYINVNNQKKYTSVTTFIKGLFPVFQKEYWAVYKHLQRIGHNVRKANNGLILMDNKLVDHRVYINDAQYIIEEWAAIAKKATDKGTALHLWLENAFNNKIINVDYDTTVVNQFYEDYKHLEPVYAECIVADDELELAGQVDRPFLVGDKLLDVYDYKTNAKLDFENQWEKGVNNLDNCSWNHYLLQLNTYRTLIERNTDYKVRNLRIVHIKDDTYKVLDVPKYNMDDIFRSTINN